MTLYINNLTFKQKKIYSIIEAYIRTNGIPPSVREIGELAGEKSPGSVQGILNRLEKKGVIKRQEGMARSIQLVSEESMLYTTPVYIPQIKKINKRNVHDLLNIYNIKVFLPIPENFIDKNKQYFFMPCPDNSLIEIGIKEKDMLLICKTCNVNLDDIVVLFIEGHTFICIYKENNSGDSIILKTDSNILGREIFDKNEVNIIGKLTYRFQRY